MPMPPGLPITDPILQFTTLVAIALVVQLTFERLHLPGLIGLLVAGMLLGPGGVALLPRAEVMELLGAVGLVYLMFNAGLEIDLDVFDTRRRETVTFGLLAFTLSLVPAVAAAALLLGYGWRAALLLGTLLSSHTLIAYPIVQRLGLLHRPAVIATIGGTLITDTLALAALAIVLQSGQGGALAVATPLVLLGIVAGASLWLVPKVARLLLDSQRVRRAEKALFVLAVLLLLAAVAELIETHEILGAFLAGLCLNRVLKRREELQEHMEFLGRMLFIPFFFIETGMRLKLEVFTGSWRFWMMAGLLLALVILGKSSASWLAGWYFGYRRSERLVMIGLTVPQAAATLAVTVTAREAGLFTTEMVDAVIVLIFVTCLGGPLLTRYAGKRAAS